MAIKPRQTVWCALLCLLFFPALPVLGTDAADESATIGVILPPAEFQPFHAADPETLQRGTLNAIDKKGVMIDGTYRLFSASPFLLTYDGEPMKKSKFIPGMPVGFRKNPADEITCLWDLRPELKLIP